MSRRTESACARTGSSVNGALRTALAASSSVALLGLAVITAAPAALAATPALIMGGTGMPTPTPAYVARAIDAYITPALGGSYTPVAVYTPEEGLGTLPGETMSILESAKAGIPYLEAEMAKYPGQPLVIFGYSQSGAIAIQVKKELAEYADAHPAAPVPDVTFVTIGTGSRPNGALQYREGDFYDTSILDERNRLDTPFTTIDIAMQYDIATDAPLYPINLLADLNWLLGGLYVHNNYLPLQPPFDQYNTPVLPSLEGLQGVTTPGIDTTYYFIPTENLPLFGPLRSLGVPEALIDIVEPVARVIVEWGYDRTIPPWEPTPFRLIPDVNPITATVDLVNAVGVGIGNALKAVGLETPATASTDAAAATVRPAVHASANKGSVSDIATELSSGSAMASDIATPGPASPAGRPRSSRTAVSQTADGEGNGGNTDATLRRRSAPSDLSGTDRAGEARKTKASGAGDSHSADSSAKS